MVIGVNDLHKTNDDIPERDQGSELKELGVLDTFLML